jgi:hypothetical protein
MRVTSYWFYPLQSHSHWFGWGLAGRRSGGLRMRAGAGGRRIGVEHLFLAIIRDRAAVPTQALGKLADLNRVEAGLLEVMASASYRGRAAPPAELLGGGAGAGTTDRSEEKGF